MQRRAPLRVGAPGGAQSIHRAIDLLVAVGEANETGSRLTDLAERTGLHLSTAHRVLNALVWEGMLIFDAYSKRYYLGVRVHGLVDSARYGSAQPRVRSLVSSVAELTGTAAYFYLPLMNDIISVASARAARTAPGPNTDVQARYPLGIGAAGIALLAAWPAETARRIIHFNADRYAEYGGQSPQSVLQAVKAAARVGYGLNEGVLPGVTAIGMVVRNSKGNPEAAVAAVYSGAKLSKARIKDTVDILRKQITAIEPLDYASAPSWA